MSSHQAAKTVLITGTSTGIGQHCAQYLIAQGFRVFAGVRQAEHMEHWASLNPNVRPLLLDVTCEQSIADAMQVLDAECGEQGLSGLVNNAGIAVGGPIECLTTAQWRHQFDVNVFGQLALTRACLPLLRLAEGRVVNMGSVAGLMALPFAAPYSSSKFALEAITDALRVELKPWNIHVAIIEPGSIDTPIWEKSTGWVQRQMVAWPPERVQLYDEALQAVAQAADSAGKRGLPAQVVSNAVYHALTAKKPKTRYPLGLEAKLRQAISWLPDSLRDWLIVNRVGLPN